MPFVSLLVTGRVTDRRVLAVHEHELNKVLQLQGTAQPVRTERSPWKYRAHG